MHEKISEGFDVFLHDGEKSFGAVRQVRRDSILVYVENAAILKFLSAPSRTPRRRR